MSTRRERAKTQKAQIQLVAADTEKKPQREVNQRQEKLADFLIDVAK